MSTKNKRIFLSPPHMGGDEFELVREAFESNYIAPLGPMVDAFEKEFSEYTGMPHCLAVNSGTAAIHLALRHMGLGQGDTVFASTLTFIGSITPILFQSATPVFIDCSADTWCMDPGLLKTALEESAKRGKLPKMVIPTDLYGQCSDYDALRDACAPYDIPLVMDAAEATGSTYKNKHAGTGAYAAIYSFNGNKIITTAGGGMLASTDEKLIAHARNLSQQAREPFAHYEHVEIGYNYRLSNILAAIGRGQLHALNSHILRRREIRAFYERSLGDIPGLSFMPIAAYGESNCWLTVICIDPEICGTDHETVRLALEKENVESRPVWKPMHLQPVFSGCEHVGGEISENIFDKGLCLPSGSGMSNEDLDFVASVLREAFSR